MISKEYFIKKYANQYINFLCGFLTDEEQDNLRNAWAHRLKTYPNQPIDGSLLRREKLTPHQIIGSLMVWADTPQGHAYWSKVEGRLQSVPTTFAPTINSSMNKKVSDMSDNLQPQPKETRTMPKRKIILVKFGSTTGEAYAYFTDLDLTKDDVVVVETKFGMKTAIITKTEGISKATRDLASKWVVQKVDTTAFAERQRRQSLIAEIENELDEAMQQESRWFMFEKMAESSPRIRELLDRLRELNPPQIAS